MYTAHIIISLLFCNIRSTTCWTHEPLPEVGGVKDEQDEVGKVEHVGQVEHLEVSAPPECTSNYWRRIEDHGRRYKLSSSQNVTICVGYFSSSVFYNFNILGPLSNSSRFEGFLCGIWCGILRVRITI
jgi:hypothetical protein